MTSAKYGRGTRFPAEFVSEMGYPSPAHAMASWGTCDWDRKRR